MNYESDDKMVSHPAHYQSGKYEVIDVIEEFTKDLTGIEAVDTANAIKYVLRWHKKNGKQDIEKAIWYLTHLLQHLNDQEQAKAAPKISGEECYKSVQVTSLEETLRYCSTCKFVNNAFDEPPCDVCVRTHKRECWTSREDD